MQIPLMFPKRCRPWLVAGLLPLLAACGQQAEDPANPPTSVVVAKVGLTDYSQRGRITGEIRARTESNLSFQIAGKLIERAASVGDHITVGQVLARLDPAEIQADVTTQLAAVSASEALLRQATSNFDRQQSLLDRRVATRKDYDAAQEALLTARAALEISKLQLETARDQLSHTVLRAERAGIVTASNMEVGRVAQAAETVYTIAEDGPRDAVFDVDESILATDDVVPEVTVSLISDPSVQAKAVVREVSPTVDRATGTIRVKVELKDPPAAMTLGSAIVAEASFPTRQAMVIPPAGLFSAAGRPAVWVVNVQDMTVSLKPIVVHSYESDRIIVESGLDSGETVVTRGGQMLHPGQTVDTVEEAGQ
ncbi:MAG: efflux RND transporter periplasmic adaptor subunit [Rhizobium sp.]|nr:efflux RND transporter periplasmic adaptor subunit [Rhizobium sp.]